MIEIPSNVILADEFASLGFSIGSNDLTQLTWVWTVILH
jgi:phosphoenolpyruvate synthase/pyruvate phosphate dikinase